MSKFKPGDVVRSLVEDRPYDGIIGASSKKWGNVVTLPHDTTVTTVIAWARPGSSEWNTALSPWGEREQDLELHPDPNKVMLSYMKWLTRNV